jgi:hypothetical protein
MGAMLPRRAREAVSRLMGVNEVMAISDPGSRRSYEERAAASRSGEGGPASAEGGSEPAPAQRDAA